MAPILPKATILKGKRSDLEDRWLDSDIHDICDIGYWKQSENHCAHFVSHVLGIRIPHKVACDRMPRDSSAPKVAGLMGVTVRVYDLFNSVAAKSRVLLGDKPPLSLCLVYTTIESNYLPSQNKMQDDLDQVRSDEHVGLYANEWIYHFSNKKKRVVRWQLKQWREFHHIDKKGKSDKHVALYSDLPPNRKIISI
jgi:hypothetical protein